MDPLLGQLADAERRRLLALVEVVEAEGVRVLSFRPDPDGQVSYDAVHAYFSNLMLEHTGAWTRLVIDLTGVPVLNSAALGPLIQKLREVQEARGRLVLTGMRAPALRETFSLMRFDRVFPIQADRDAAVALAARP